MEKPKITKSERDKAIVRIAADNEKLAIAFHEGVQQEQFRLDLFSRMESNMQQLNGLLFKKEGK